MSEIEKAIETIRQVSDLDAKWKLNIDTYDLLTAIEALKEKAQREKAQEICQCKNNLKACCTCVSMYCYECINKSEYVMGSFCSCCGKKLVSEE